MQDLGRAVIFMIGELLRGHQGWLEYRVSGYYWVETFGVSLMDPRVIGERLFKEGKIGTPEVQIKTQEELTKTGRSVWHILLEVTQGLGRIDSWHSGGGRWIKTGSC
jgi:hypothetical protein